MDKIYAAPLKKLTVMIDACVYRGNPAVGEQLACMIEMLQKHGVQCEVVQDRLGLVEATNHTHPLMLSEDINNLWAQYAGSAEEAHRASRFQSPCYVTNYITINNDLAPAVQVKLVNNGEFNEIHNERIALTQQYLFNDPRLHSEWPEVKRKLRNNQLRVSDLDDYHHALFTVCSKCSHTIEAIHERMKHEKGFRASITREDRADFMLDRFPEGRKVYWDNIDLEHMNPKQIPIPVVDSFGKTRMMQHLLGKGDHLTELGRRVLGKQTDLGEKIMEKHARKMIAADSDPGHAVLLISDDGNALKGFEKLHDEIPAITDLSSRELATITCNLASRANMRAHFPRRVLQAAENIDQGLVKTDSPISRSAHNIMSGDESFVSRVEASMSNNGIAGKT